MHLLVWIWENCRRDQVQSVELICGKQFYVSFQQKLKQKTETEMMSWKGWQFSEFRYKPFRKNILCRLIKWAFEKSSFLSSTKLFFVKLITWISYKYFSSLTTEAFGWWMWTPWLMKSHHDDDNNEKRGEKREKEN